MLRVVVNGSRSTGRAVTGGVPQGSVPGLEVFNTFVSALDSGTECTLSMLTDHSLCGAATGKGRHPEGPGQAWAHANLMMFSKEKHKVPCLGHGSPGHTGGLGGDEIEKSPVENLGVMVH